MLQQTRAQGDRLRAEEWDSDASGSEVIDFDKIMAIARRQWRVVALATIVALMFGFAYTLTAVPLYTATTNVLIDQSNSKIADQLAVLGGGLEDEAAILSQVEILKSEKVGLSVVDKLDLSNDPTFMASAGSPLTRLKTLLRSVVDFSSWFASRELTEGEREARRRSALARVQGNMDVKRVGRTYVLEVNYTSPSPQQAARVARAIAEAYLTDQLDSKYDATRRASDWLQARIAELRQKSLDSDLAVQKFKTEKGLISTGGQLVSEQKLSELNSALIVAQSDTARAKARYERIKSIMDSGQTDAIVTDALDSSVINTLRAKYLDASKREAEISNRLGENHVQAVRLRNEMSEYQRLMFEELGRIAESYQSEYAVAQDRERSIRDEVATAANVSATDNETQVQLRELERESETYKNLYQTFLQRFQEATQQQSFPVTEARIITQAAVPEVPSFPRKSLVLALSVVLGGMAGAGIGAFREFRDRFFRTGEQVRDELGLEFLGLGPLLTGAAVAQAGEPHPRIIRKASTITNYSVDHPMSSFAETLRSAKIAADLAIGDRLPKIIGIVSTLPGEGKTTVSANFAELLASQGSRTLLIDGDLRSPGLTRALARHAEAGLVEAVLEGRPLKDLLLVNPDTKLALLPAVVKRRIPHTSELLASPAMAALLREAGQSFDHIVIDLPPMAPVVDARAVAARIDAFLFVVEWGRTSRRVVRTTLQTEPQVFDKCLGVILNKADQEQMKYYRAYGSSEYYYSRYQSYYHADS